MVSYAYDDAGKSQWLEIIEPIEDRTQQIEGNGKRKDNPDVAAQCLEVEQQERSAIEEDQLSAQLV